MEGLIIYAFKAEPLLININLPFALTPTALDNNCGS